MAPTDLGSRVALLVAAARAVSDRVPLTGVRGGSHGLAASYEHARALASSFDGAGNRMRDWARAGGRVLRNGDLVESALLAPWSFAEAELAVLDATTGRDGILVESVGWETDALLIRGAVSAFEQVDALVAATFEVVDYAAGPRGRVHARGGAAARRRRERGRGGRLRLAAGGPAP